MYNNNIQLIHQVQEILVVLLEYLQSIKKKIKIVMKTSKATTIKKHPKNNNESFFNAL
jgi:hypothetical protein